MKLMRLFRRRPGACPEHLTGWQIDGQETWPCELPPDGHEYHERTSSPLQVRWKRVNGGVHVVGASMDASQANTVFLA